MKGRQRALTPEFTFAGFTFPRYIGNLPSGTKKERQDRYKFTGGYYVAPRPEGAGKSLFCYLQRPGRWVWCDEINGARIRHNGWFCDLDGDETIRGIVLRITHGRYLAGWSIGVGMATSFDGSEIYTDEIEAALNADRLAEIAAEKNREYQEQENERIDREEAEIQRNMGTDDEETTY